MGLSANPVHCLLVVPHVRLFLSMLLPEILQPTQMLQNQESAVACLSARSLSVS